MNKSPPSSRGQAPYTPRRPSTSGSQRPSTSSGEAIEPTSAILRDALREKKGIQPRARSTTPRRVRAGVRSQSYRDEWLQSSDDESVSGKRSSAQRPPRPRRVSDLGANKSTPPVSRNLGSREADSKIDKLEKENWDLKHRIMLYQERAKTLSDKLDENEADLERLGVAEERSRELAEEVESLQQRLNDALDENSSLQENNVELTDINEELVKQLETRVQELEAAEKDTAARQSAIEEAAGIIQNLEQRLSDMETDLKTRKQLTTPARHADSDYFSGDTVVSHPAGSAPPVTKPPQLSHSADSDYFSADTSPLVTPKSLKKASAPIPAKEAPRLAAAQQTALSFNRELGLRSITSKDSLLSGYLESPSLPPPTSVAERLVPLRSLRKRTLSSKALRTPTSKPTAPEASKEKKSLPQGWSDTRPLRNLYMTGELGLQIDSHGIPVPPIAPSEMSSRASSYSSSLEDDKYGDAKAKSTGCMPAFLGRSNSVATRSAPTQPPAMRGRANSINSKVHPMPTRTNTLPGKPIHRSSLRRSSTDRPLPALPRSLSSHRSSTSSRMVTTPPHPLASHPVKSGSNISPKSSSSNPSSLNRPALATSYTTPPSQSAPTFSTTKPADKTPSPNYAIWPKRYPAWPPSAGLLNRSGLFQGEGLDEIFGGAEEAADNPATHF